MLVRKLPACRSSARPVSTSFCSEEPGRGSSAAVRKPGREHTGPGHEALLFPSRSSSRFCHAGLLQPEASGARGRRRMGPAAIDHGRVRETLSLGILLSSLLLARPSACSPGDSLVLMRDGGHVRTRQMENWLLLIKRNRVVNCCGGIFPPLSTVPFAILIYQPKIF